MTPTQERLVLNRFFKAPIQTVFAAWTTTEALTQWFGPEGFEVLKAECDLCVGGQYEILIQSPENTTIRHFGEYVEINAPHQLIFTWILDSQECQGSKDQHSTTLVSLLFEEVPDGTALTLTHEKLPDQTAYDGHKFGWLSSFDSLTTHLNNQ